jgi:kynureninase
VVILDVADGMGVTNELARREILVDFRPGAGIRMAPHFYTTDEEIEFALGEIRKIAAQRRSV